MVAIRKTCGVGGQNRAQLQPTMRSTSWTGENSTPGLGRQTESGLSSVYVNDGVWDSGVCIDYRICLTGHNSLQDCQRSVMPQKCKLCNPHKSTHMTHDVNRNTSILKTSSCFCKAENSAMLARISLVLGLMSVKIHSFGVLMSLLFWIWMTNQWKCRISLVSLSSSYWLGTKFLVLYIKGILEIP